MTENFAGDEMDALNRHPDIAFKPRAWTVLAALRSRGGGFRALLVRNQLPDPATSVIGLEPPGRHPHGTRSGSRRER